MEAAASTATAEDEATLGRSSDLRAPELNQELLFEERLGRIMAQNEKLLREKKDLQKDLRELDKRLSRLQENNDALQQKLRTTEDRLREDSSKGSEDIAARRLEVRVLQQEDLIASQEARILEFQERTDVLQGEVHKLNRASERLQPLQDELDEVRVQRDLLSKKANTLDKYRQKLQASQDLEKANQLLRGELEELRQLDSEGGQASTQVAGLQRTVEEYKNLIPVLERDRHDSQMMMRQLERDNVGLGQQLDAANERIDRQEETIKELSGSGGANGSPDRDGQGLDSEIETSERREASS